MTAAIPDPKETIKEKPDFPEAFAEPGRGKTKFVCGSCKQAFYANRRKNNIVICPHCKGKASLPEPGPSGWGTIISLIFLIGSVFSKGRRS